MSQRNNKMQKGRSRPKSTAKLRRRRRAPRSRRGVLLLITLSLLVLFMMIGTAFVITAKQSRDTAKSQNIAQLTRSAERAQVDLLEETLRQLIRGTDNPNSVMRDHDLLGDMYGNDGLICHIVNTQWARDLSNNAQPSNAPGGLTGGQLVQFDLAAPLTDVRGQSMQLADAASGGAQSQLSRLDDAYNGQVLTFISRGAGALSARSVSTRIVDYIPLIDPTSGVMNGATLTVLTFPLADGTDLYSAANNNNNGLAGLDGSRILINGRPFNGTGVGYDRHLASVGDANVRNDAFEILPTPSGGTVSAPIALLPNSAFFIPTGTTLRPTGYFGSRGFNPGIVGTTPPLAGLGGADESWDAPDFQNMALAYQNLDGRADDIILPDPTVSTLPTDLDDLPLPSFHRPALINFWWKSTLGRTAETRQGNAGIVRRAMLRPNWFDHPNFDGSNSELTPWLAAWRANPSSNNSPAMDALLARMVYGPWDVDNDGDGVRDSVWIDFGASVMTAPDGRLVKPLAAVMVLDLDGRVNVNVHGSLDLARDGGANSSRPASRRLEMTRLGNQNQALAGPQMPQWTASMPRGLGMGPGDVSLRPIFDRQEMMELLSGRTDANGAVVLAGRYGTDRIPGRPGFDMLAQMRLFQFPDRADGRAKPSRSNDTVLPANSQNRVNVGGAVSPIDLRARYGMGVNEFGQPIWEATDLDPITREATRDIQRSDSPYEMNMTTATWTGDNQAAADAPFSLAELERVYRAFDVDAPTLPNRLWDAGNFGSKVGDGESKLVTTDSYDPPAPNVALPENMRAMVSTNQDFSRPPRSVAELMEIRVRDALGFTKFPEPYANASQGQQVRTIVRRLLAPELAAGTRLDVNRPFGNGIDDNEPGTPGYGVVDEPDPPEIGTPMLSLTRNSANNAVQSDPLEDQEAVAKGAFNQVAFPNEANDPLADDSLGSVPHRQMYARHLYTLALMLTTDEQFTGTRRQDRELTRRVAQWAVNAVDFRDPDSIMSWFEYDPNPFDGWDVDDVLTTTADRQSNAGGGAASENLVWGCERPELVLTETLAWHDRRTEDHADDEPPPFGQKGPIGPDPQKDDRDYDNLFRPRGGAMIELYNPWPEMPAASADTHARSEEMVANERTNVDLGVNLAAEAGGSPVWRLAIYKDGGLNLDPENPLTSKRPKELDRTVYFTRQDPNFADDAAAFYSSWDVPPVRPGRYMVVSAGESRTAIPAGSRPPQDTIYELPLGNVNPQFGNINDPTRRFELLPNYKARGGAPLRFIDPNRPDIVPPRVSEVLRMQPGQPGADSIRDLDQYMTDVAIIDQPRRFTLTEPARGYPQTWNQAVWIDEDGPGGNEGQYRLPDRVTPRPIGQPLDDDRADGSWNEASGQVADADKLTDGESRLSLPFLANLDDGIIENFSHIYLQRLANPLRPYDAVTNPYLTVDSTSANVSVFNGRSPLEEMYAGEQKTTYRNREAVEAFASLERGKRNERGPAAPQGTNRSQVSANLWKPEPTDRPHKIKNLPGRAAGAKFNFPGLPEMTMGWLNDAFVYPQRDRTQPAQGTTTAGGQNAAPAKPFPWLVWNDRPFVSGNELMLVPTSRPARLLSEFTRNRGDDPYKVKIEQDPQTESPVLPTYGHLMPMMDANPQSDANNPYPRHLYRLLEYVHTPSLFVGTEQWVNPTTFGQTPNSTAPAPQSTLDPRVALQAPFNSLSMFRDPGRVNINTIPSSDVWDCIEHDYEVGNNERRKHLGPPWASNDGIAKSRRGYDQGGEVLQLDVESPTFFANPFRSPDAGDMVPLPSMLRQGVECTLLRSDGATQPGAQAQPGPPSPGNTPLMYDPNGGVTTPQSQTAYRADDPRYPQNINRHAAMYFAPMTRLDNLITTRSNVYAVWITIGFFEVEPAPQWDGGDGVYPSTTYPNASVRVGDVFADNPALYARAYPDGYMLGEEAGVETGENRRLRGFYVIDRSLPAGYEPGVDHNVDQLIRLRRRIE